MKNKLQEINEKLAKISEMEREKRIRESELLSPEFDYLEIDEDGYLKEPYPIFGTSKYTCDKVYAAGMIYGLEMMNENNEDYGWIPYYKARNEINERVGRKKLYSNRDILSEKERCKGR